METTPTNASYQTVGTPGSLEHFKGFSLLSEEQMCVDTDGQHFISISHQQINPALPNDLGDDAVVLSEQDKSPGHLHPRQGQHSCRQTFPLDDEPHRMVFEYTKL